MVQTRGLYLNSVQNGCLFTVDGGEPVMTTSGRDFQAKLLKTQTHKPRFHVGCFHQE